MGFARFVLGEGFYTITAIPLSSQADPIMKVTILFIEINLKKEMSELSRLY